ncbi:MAG: right-handed parallel beta-helix repeat-containing protein [Anaerolineae bacterium]
MEQRKAKVAALIASVPLLLIALAALLALPSETAAQPTTYYVGGPQGRSPNDSNSCTSTCYPCATIQGAIEKATDGDEIWVYRGTYTGTLSIAKTLTLEGGYWRPLMDCIIWDDPWIRSSDPEANPTTLDAQGQGRVVYIYGDISPTIDGFIITGGNADAEAHYRRQGGGIYSTGADPVIQNNVITANIASTSTSASDFGFGGGLYLYDASASALVSGNQILSNTASTGYTGYGGGLYLHHSDATVSGNTISGNTAGIAPNSEGGGVMLNYSNATLDGNRIISNTAPGGGALNVVTSAPFTLTNNVIAQNRADGVAGGIRVWGSVGLPTSGALINNTIAQNNLGNGKTGVYAFGTTTLTLTNNIVVSHTWGIYAFSGDTVTADYTLFFGNTVGDAGGPGAITSTHEVSGDPLFADPEYHIQVTSPAINKGTFSGAPATDFEGDPRPYDCFVDIGADENTASDQCKRVYLPLILKNY